MRRLFLWFIFFIPGFYALADNYDFSALQGLKGKKEDIYFEISGYEIFCNSVRGKLNSLQTIVDFKKRQKIKGIQAEYSDPKLLLPNKIIETETPLEKNPDIKLSTVYYLFAKTENEIKYIVFQTINHRDILLEKEFINAFFEGKLASYISDEWKGETISFAGRTIRLGDACEWRSPHNLYCKGGQISWSEFPSAESADLDLDMRIAANSKYSEILSEEDIHILFEDVPTIANRVVYMEKNANYPLVVYYIAQEVRGRYLSCTMSNYGYNRNDYELSYLLQQFMSIPTMPDWAYNPLDVPQHENAENNGGMNFWLTPNYEVRLGSIFPLGDLKKVFEFAPSFGFFFGIPIKQKMSVELGGMFLFPAKPHPFDYTIEGETNQTKATVAGEGSLRFRYRHTLSKNLFCNTYCGIGLISISTDLVEGVDTDNQKTYYSVDALDLYGGIRLDYKKWGCFIEYHQTNLSNSSKVANNFGNNFLSTGFAYSF